MKPAPTPPDEITEVVRETSYRTFEQRQADRRAREKVERIAYTWAALKATDNRWYLTGGQNMRLTWDELQKFISDRNVTEIFRVTGWELVK